MCGPMDDVGMSSRTTIRTHTRGCGPRNGHRFGQEGETTMPFTVLVPLDGSPLAARALPFAAHLASIGGGLVVLAHVRSSLHPDVHSNYDPAQDVEKLRREGVK